MRLHVAYLRTNPYTHVDEVVPEGAEYGFWRIVETIGEHNGQSLTMTRDALYTTELEALNAVARLAFGGKA